MKDLTIHYKSEVMQKRWEKAVAWLRKESKNGWILDKRQEKKCVTS